MYYLRFIFCLVTFLALLSRQPLLAQTAQQSPSLAAQGKITSPSTTDAKLNNIASKCLPLNATVSVTEQASVEAVLIPHSVGRRIFGEEVAKNYAVVELVVSNRDSKAALIVQSVFLDAEQWLLSGLSSKPPAPALDDSNQRANKPWQVASVEARLIRGQLLDAQQWSARNWTIRSLTLIGSIASGVQFPFTANVAKGIAAFNGNLVPGISVLWPDGATNQINRISDFGFQTNKIIPKEASDIIVAFFPIDRFLTAGFHKMFVNDPAAFFMPTELLVDPETSSEVSKFVLPLAHAIYSSVSKENLLQIMSTALLADCPPHSDSNNCKLQQMFSRLSLNSVRVVVGGVMSVDAASVPPTIYSVDFKDGNQNADIWTRNNKKWQGTITGLYLSGGTPKVVDAQRNNLSQIHIDPVSAGSSDTKLAFTMSVDPCIPSSTDIYFVVTKPAKTVQPVASESGDTRPSNTDSTGSASIPSSPYSFKLPAYSCPK